METYSYGDERGRYVFELDMRDSLCRYDLTFFSSIEDDDVPQCFPMKIYLHSPSGQEYSETVFYNRPHDTVRVPYREDLQPVEWGVWTLEAIPMCEGLHGLGLICSKKK